MDNGLHFPVDGDTACLFYGHKRTQTLYSVSPYNPKASLKRIPQLRHKVILDYSHGWFVLRDSKDMTLFFLYNPVTLDLINLPPLLAAQSIKDIFGTIKSPPDCDDCVLILCASHEGPLFLCSPSKPDFGWLTQLLEFDGDTLLLLDYVTLHGVFYIVAYSDSHIIDRFFELDLDVSNSRVIFRPLEELHVRSFKYCYDNIFRKYFMVESCGQLYIVWLSSIYSEVCSSFEVKTVKVFEFDLCSSTSREINSLNGRSFFICGANSTWCWGNTDDPVLQSGGGIQRDCIYLILGDNDNLIKLYVYNLIDKTLMPLRHGPDLFRPIHHPVWVIPQQLRLSSMNERIKKVDNNPRHHGVLGRNEGQQTRWDDLPIHLVEYISKFMHLFEYWNFRASCKLFLSLCPEPRWRTNNAIPLFMIFDEHNFGSCKMIDPHRTDDPRFSTLPLSPFPFTVKFSNKGWLLTIVDEEHFEFYNIFTGAKGKFLSLDRAPVKSVGFSTYPTDPDCLTVVVDTELDGRVHIYLYLSKIKGWIERRWIDSQFSVSNCNPVFLDGAFYFLDTEGNLGVYRQLKGKLTLGNWTVYDKPETIEKFHSCYLVDCEGKLYSVFMGKLGKWIRLYRFDETVMRWVEINCLENHCFFISGASTFSIVARDPTMRNRIYLPRFKGNKMIYYSLDTRKFHVLGSEGFLENLYGTSEPSNCCWM